MNQSNALGGYLGLTGIDCNLNKSCRPCPCCIECTTRLNYVPLYTCTFSFFCCEKFGYSLNENSPLKMYKGKNVEILFTLKRDKKREKTRLRVIGCYWYLDRAYTHTPSNTFFHLFSVSGALHFFFLFPFMKWRKDSHRKWKRKMLNWRLAFVILFSSSSTDDGICCHHSFFLSKIFHFQFVLGWRRTIELSSQYLFIIIACILLSRFIRFYPKPVTNNKKK